MCTAPLLARRVDGQIEFLGGSRESRAFFSRKKSDGAATLEIPCGQCAECRLKRSREWAIRGSHEALMHDHNSFLTLTYSPDKLESPSLIYDHFQLFLKRLRSRFPFDKFSYMVCGEYGETNPDTRVKDGGLYRPHFHAILFGLDFPDKKPVRLLGQTDLFRSDILDSVWGYGDCRIGDVTFESISYVARYIMKKVTGDLAKAHYTVVLPTGEIIERAPEMFHSSKNPAIGKRWFLKYGAAAYAHDSVIAHGREMMPPRYYDKLLPEVVRGMVLDNRIVKGRKKAADHTDDRNAVRDVVVTAGLSQFTRE